MTTGAPGYYRNTEILPEHWNTSKAWESNIPVLHSYSSVLMVSITT